MSIILLKTPQQIFHNQDKKKQVVDRICCERLRFTRITRMIKSLKEEKLNRLEAT